MSTGTVFVSRPAIEGFVNFYFLPFHQNIDKSSQQSETEFCRLKMLKTNIVLLFQKMRFYILSTIFYVYKILVSNSNFIYFSDDGTKVGFICTFCTVADGALIFPTPLFSQLQGWPGCQKILFSCSFLKFTQFWLNSSAKTQQIYLSKKKLDFLTPRPSLKLWK